MFGSSRSKSSEAAAPIAVGVGVGVGVGGGGGVVVGGGGGGGRLGRPVCRKAAEPTRLCERGQDGLRRKLTLDRLHGYFIGNGYKCERCGIIVEWFKAMSRTSDLSSACFNVVGAQTTLFSIQLKPGEIKEVDLTSKIPEPDVRILHVSYTAQCFEGSTNRAHSCSRETSCSGKASKNGPFLAHRGPSFRGKTIIHPPSSDTSCMITDFPGTRYSVLLSSLCTTVGSDSSGCRSVSCQIVLRCLSSKAESS
jgi:hypothetical protein